MSIRSTCKAIVLNDGKILLNKCHDIHNGEYYSLPGGGQETLEFLEEAIIREVLEETGYTVIPDMFVGIGEEICTDEEIVQQWPGYIHKMYHIYRCYLDEKIPWEEPSEVDDMQDESVWMPIAEVENITLLPKMVQDNFKKLVFGDHAIYLDSIFVAHHHG